MKYLKRLYDWVLSWADSPYGTLALFIVAFSESSFFIVPPDVLLIALAVSKPGRAFYYALVTTVGSVLGGDVRVLDRCHGDAVYRCPDT